MKYTAAPLADVWIIDPVRYSDARGYFCEVFRKDEFERAVGRHVDFVQENESFSTRGVVRGLHFQSGDASQAKLVRVSEGCIVDVAVDLRRSSPTFQYKVDNYYCPSAERILRLDDSIVGVEWPFSLDGAILSPKDAAGLAWDEIEKFD